MEAVEIIFWVAVALLVHTHLAYPLTLWALARLRGRDPAAGAPAPLPRVSMVIAAHDEEDVIEAKLADVAALDYPRERLEVVVASDGSGDRTVEVARAAGADLVLDLPRQGKISAQNEAVSRSGAEVIAFSDANAYWEPAALRELVAPFADPRVGYVCGRVRFTDPAGDNLEGAYWRYEMAVRELESRLGGVTAGNGAIYAVRRQAYLHLGPSRSHDLSFPFQLRRRGWRSLYAPGARASEKMVPTAAGERSRKRRMMRGLWDIVIADAMLSPRGYGPLYAYEVYSHRGLRYASPFLHLIALGTNFALLGSGWIYALTLGAQLALVAAAALAPLLPLAPFRAAAYYLGVTGSIALGLWDRLRHGPPAAWEKAEGTR